MSKLLLHGDGGWNFFKTLFPSIVATERKLYKKGPNTLYPYHNAKESQTQYLVNAKLFGKLVVILKTTLKNSSNVKLFVVNELKHVTIRTVNMT